MTTAPDGASQRRQDQFAATSRQRKAKSRAKHARLTTAEKDLLDAVLRYLGYDGTGAEREKMELRLLDIIEDYRSNKVHMDSFDSKNYGKWMREVAASASVLAGLLENAPDPKNAAWDNFLLTQMLPGSRTDPLILIADLRLLADEAKDTPKLGRPKNWALKVLILGLAGWFHMYRGKPANASRLHDGGSPTGDFFHAVNAMLYLADATESEETVYRLIREHADQMRNWPRANQHSDTHGQNGDD